MTQHRGQDKATHIQSHERPHNIRREVTTTSICSCALVYYKAWMEAKKSARARASQLQVQRPSVEESIEKDRHIAKLEVQAREPSGAFWSPFKCVFTTC